MDLWKTFSSAWTADEVRARPEFMAAAYQNLQRRYAEPHRRHHVWYHIEEGVKLMSEFRNDLSHFDRLVLAYFYHDEEYGARQDSNERISADHMGIALRGAGALEEAVVAIDSYIMDTAHSLHRECSTLESQLIVSVDLATLGFAPELFDRYSKNIYMEYVDFSGVEPQEFLKGQHDFFKHMLAKPVIYPFAPLHQRYDAQTRENLNRAIKAYEARTAVK